MLKNQVCDINLKIYFVFTDITELTYYFLNTIFNNKKVIIVKLLVVRSNKNGILLHHLNHVFLHIFYTYF